EIFGELSSLFDDDATELVAEGERPRQRLRPVAPEDMKIGAAHPAGADLNERGVRRDLRPRHRADDRLGAGTGEGGESDGAGAHGTRAPQKIYPVLVASGVLDCVQVKILSSFPPRAGPPAPPAAGGPRGGAPPPGPGSPP